MPGGSCLPRKEPGELWSGSSKIWGSLYANSVVTIYRGLRVPLGWAILVVVVVGGPSGVWKSAEVTWRVIRMWGGQSSWGSFEHEGDQLGSSRSDAGVGRGVGHTWLVWWSPGWVDKVAWRHAGCMGVTWSVNGVSLAFLGEPLVVWQGHLRGASSRKMESGFAGLLRGTCEFTWAAGLDRHHGKGWPELLWGIAWRRGHFGSSSRGHSTGRDWLGHRVLRVSVCVLLGLIQDMGSHPVLPGWAQLEE